MTMYHPDIANIIYGSYIRYDRLYEMTNFAFYGDTSTNCVNIYIDAYSILKDVYKYGLDVRFLESSVVASGLINLAIHLRAYFNTRHRVHSKIYIVYGGARPREAIVNYPYYNHKNIEMEDSNSFMKDFVTTNLSITELLCPYLDDIFCIVDYRNEFNTMVSALINGQPKAPNIIYSKDPLAYQLVAFKSMTFLYRPKKKNKHTEDKSWVVTKSTIYDAYRYGELFIKTQRYTNLDVKLFSLFQALAGVRSRNILSIKNANVSIKLLEEAISMGCITNGYNGGILQLNVEGAFRKFLGDGVNIPVVLNRFAAIDLNYQTMLYKNSVASNNLMSGVINLYNPQELRMINDRYFQQYPLDLIRV